MKSCADLRILFRAPAGPRRGFSHLVRCRALARALGVRPLMSMRGGRSGEEAALALGCDVVHGGPGQLLESLAPDVLVVDEPVTSNARRWIAAGRRAGCLVVSVHDLGLGCLDADLVIDGGMTTNARSSHGTTPGVPRFALLDPSLLHDEEARNPYTVFVAPGGGPLLELALEIAQAIVDTDPRATVRLSGGFLSTHQAFAPGTRTIGVPAVAAQRQTVAELVARGPGCGAVRGPVSAMDAAEECVSLLSDAAVRRRLSVSGGRLIDERGAVRAAAALTRLASKTPWR
jgi:hypothetical protein